MNAPNNSAQARAWRRRTAAVFAAVGALVFSSGLVMITAPAAHAGAGDKVNVCHRTASDNHPYVFQRVAEDSAALNAHMDHRDENAPANGGEDKYWNSAGTWNGMQHEAGDFKPDYIEGVDPEMAVGADAARDWCLNNQVTVTLAQLDITPVAACGTYGAISKPADTAYLVYTINQPAWDHLSGTVVVTATLVNGASGFKGSTRNWEVAEDELSATRTVDVGQFTACPSGTLATPQFEAIDACGEYGSITRPVSDNVSYLIDGTENWAVTTGTHTVTATLVNGATSFTDAPAGWTVDGTTASYEVNLGSFEECPEGVLVDVQANPIEACDTWGSVRKPADSSTVVYSITGGAWTGLQGEQTVTATLVGGATEFDAASLDGWTLAADKLSATRTFALGEFTECDDSIDPVEDVLVTPNYPSAGSANCSRDGKLRVPGQPAGVLVSQSGSAPGDVNFTFAPAEGYAFPEGTDTEVVVTVPAQLTGDECLLGEEGTKPRPKPKPRDRAPIVLGSHAAVPTAVAAGVAGLPTTSVSSTSSPQLAQALVAGGLLMLVAGASMGLGRRTRGIHES